MMPFDKIIGVELDSVSAEMCRVNVKTLQEKKPELILSEGTEIHTMNMSDFEYPKDTAIVLYMYEPLWNLSKVDANDIYVKVLSKAIKSSKSLTVVYFPSSPWNGDAMKALTELGGQLLLKNKVPSLIFGNDDSMYIFQFESREPIK
jgi:predicted RNA methylase